MYTKQMNNLTLQQAFTNIRCPEECNRDKPGVGDTWEIESGISITLLTKASSPGSRFCRLLVTATPSATGLPCSLTERSTPASRVSLCDFIGRQFQTAIKSSRAARTNGVRFIDFGPYCLETNWVTLCGTNGNVHLVFEVEKDPPASRTGPKNSDTLVEAILSVVKVALVNRDQPGGGLDVDAAQSHVEVRMIRHPSIHVLHMINARKQTRRTDHPYAWSYCSL